MASRKSPTSATGARWVTHTQRLRVAGIDLRILDTGVPMASEEPTLLVLNGSAAPLEVIGPFVDLMAAHRRVIAFDQPGMGDSQAVLPTLTIPQLAGLSLAVLDTLQVDAVDVLGYSFGGAIAQQLALTAASRVHRLILLASIVGVGGLATDPVTLCAVVAHQTGVLRSLGCRQLARRGYGGVVSVDDSALRDLERAVSGAPADPGSFLGQAIAAGSWSSLPWLWAIRCPTLVLTGDEDLIVPVANAMLLATWIPGAKLHLVRGAGHLMVLDQCADVARAVNGFLTASRSSATRSAMLSDTAR